MPYHGTVLFPDDPHCGVDARIRTAAVYHRCIDAGHTIRRLPLSVVPGVADSPTNNAHPITADLYNVIIISIKYPATRHVNRDIEDCNAQKSAGALAGGACP